MIEKPLQVRRARFAGNTEALIIMGRRGNQASQIARKRAARLRDLNSAIAEERRMSRILEALHMIASRGGDPVD